MDKDIENLFSTILDFCKKYEFEIVIQKENDEEIDFINMNIKTKQVYFGNLEIEEKY